MVRTPLDQASIRPAVINALSSAVRGTLTPRSIGDHRELHQDGNRAS